MTKSLRTKWEDRYSSGVTPWDTEMTPPEVDAFWASGRLPSQGLALDVGCGPGTNVLYLARQGLVAIGFDIAFQPVSTGRQRMLARAPELAQRAWLIQADVTALPVYAAGASYILDLGCSHGLPQALRANYATGIVANLRSGGYYHLYAFDFVERPATDGEDRNIGLYANEVIERFTPALELVEIVEARPDPYPCRWYLLRKP